MRIRNQPLLVGFALAFLSGGLIGYFAGHRNQPTVVAKAAPVATVGAVSPRTTFSASAFNEPYRFADASEAASLRTGDDLGERIRQAVSARDYFRRRHDIYVLGQRLDATSILAAMEAAQRLPETARENAQYPLLARWLELDSEAAYRWVNALPVQARRKELLQEFFHSLGLKDPQAALSFLAQHSAHSTRREDFTDSVIEAWSSHDPSAAVDAALSIANPSTRKSAAEIALQRLAKRDPHAALARLSRISEPEVRRGHQREVLEAWAEEDPLEAAAHVQNLPAGKERNGAFASVVCGAAAKDPETAMRLLDHLPAGSARNEALQEIVRKISDDSPMLAAEVVLAMEPGQQIRSIHHVIHSLAEADLPEAIEWASRLASADTRRTAMRTVMQTWSASDPKAAAEYCARDAAAGADLIDDALSVWVRQDAPTALAWVRGLPAGALREAAWVATVDAIAGRDPQEAVQLATSWLDKEKSADAMSRIGREWASKDPAAAVAWAAQLADDATRRGVESQIASVWAEEDPAAAAAWASQLPHNMYLVSNVVRVWAEQDAKAAAQWLNKQPVSPSRDEAVRQFSTTIVDWDPAGAAEWAATISQPEERHNALMNVFQQWKRIEPVAATAWLRSSAAVSQQLREQVLRNGE